MVFWQFDIIEEVTIKYICPYHAKTNDYIIRFFSYSTLEADLVFQSRIQVFYNLRKYSNCDLFYEIISVFMVLDQESPPLNSKCSISGVFLFCHPN